MAQTRSWSFQPKEQFAIADRTDCLTVGNKQAEGTLHERPDTGGNALERNASLTRLVACAFYPYLGPSQWQGPKQQDHNEYPLAFHDFPINNSMFGTTPGSQQARMTRSIQINRAKQTMLHQAHRNKKTYKDAKSLGHACEGAGAHAAEGSFT